MLPRPRSSIGPSARCKTWKWPVKLMSRIRCHSSAGRSVKRKRDVVPALPTSRVTVPNSASTRSNMAWTAARSATSAGTIQTRRPIPAISSAKASAARWPRALLLWLMATSAPACANRRQQAAPMPRAPPVTRATSPSRSIFSMTMFLSTPPRHLTTSPGKQRGTFAYLLRPSVPTRRPALPPGR